MGCTGSKAEGDAKPTSREVVMQAGSGVISEEDKLPAPSAEEGEVVPKPEEPVVEGEKKEEEAVAGEGEPAPPPAAAPAPPAEEGEGGEGAPAPPPAEAPAPPEGGEAPPAAAVVEGEESKALTPPAPQPPVDAGKSPEMPQSPPVAVVAAVEEEGKKSPQPEAEAPAEGTPTEGQSPTLAGGHDGAAWAQQSPMGLYLKFDPKDNGTFLAVWSKVYDDKSLAYARPSTYFTVPDYKFKKPIVIQSRALMGKTMYYQAWCQFVKESKACNAEFVILPASNNSEVFPGINLWYHVGEKVVKQALGSKPTNLKYVDVVAGVSPAYDGFNLVHKSSGCPRQKFMQIARSSAEQFALVFKD